MERLRFLPGSLRGRLMLLVFLAALPGFILLIANSIIERNRAENSAQEMLARIARNIALKGRERTEDTRRLLKMITEFPSVQAGDAAHCVGVLPRVREAFDIYENLGVTAPDGRIWCSALPFDRAVVLSDRDWYRRAIASGDFAIGSHQVGRITGRDTVNFALPVFDAGGRVSGMAFAALGTTWFTHITREVNLPESAILLLTDSNGIVISRRPYDTQYIGRRVTADMILPISDRGCRGTAQGISLDGRERLFAYAPFVEGRADSPCVLVGLPNGVLLAPIEAEFRRGLLFVSAATLLVLLLAWFGANTLILRRVGHLAKTMERFGAGDHTARAAFRDTDEIGNLGHHFDSMADQLALKSRELTHANQALRALSYANQAIVGAEDESRLLVDICNAVVKGGGYRMAWIGYVDNASGLVLPITSTGHVDGYLDEIHISTDEAVPEGRGAIGTAIRTGQTVVVHDIAENPSFAPWRVAALKRGYASMIALPLKRDGRTFGSLNIYAAEPNAFDGGSVSLLTEISEDLTYGLESLSARVAKRAAEESNRMKTEFLANMSHELRTPLTAIIGFSEILRDGLAGPVSPRQRDYAGEILASGQHLLELINDILDLTKVEAGRMVLELAPADLRTLLAASLSIVREKAQAHRIALEMEAEQALGEVLLDERKFKQITYNLLSNAVKFTPDGGKVRLSARQVAREEIPVDSLSAKYGHYLEICVSDTGPGISPEDQKRLFQSFVQLDSGLARQYEGTGLGLALVKRLAELHGGAVSVDSAPGKGTRFSVWLPYRDASAEAPEDAQPPSGGEAALQQGSLVLIVEDDPYAARLISHQLQEAGMSSVTVPTGEAALSRLEKAPRPDLITLDILLPGMDGWELLAELKRRSGLGDIPVVIISIVADREKGLSLGAAGVLQKPFTRKDLASSLLAMDLGHADGPIKVLAIDDDPSVLALIRSHLEDKPIEIQCARNGMQGLEMARATPPDLIILDLMMPGMDGFEVAEALRRDEITAQIPILVLTAKLLTSEDRARLNGQVERIMQKSDFNHGSFIMEVHRALARSRTKT
ncbi:MAG: response regulator [Pseudomonadota bacterium]